MKHSEEKNSNSCEVICDKNSLNTTLDKRMIQLENLTKNIPGGVHQCLNNDEWTIMYMNDGFLTLTGYTREEITNIFKNQFSNLIYLEDLKPLKRQMIEQLKIGNEVEIEYRILCKNGETIWVLDKSRIMKDSDGRESFYGILIEISDRRQQQEHLRLTLEKHQVIMDQATDIIFEWDINSDTLVFSQNWEKKFGYEAIDQSISNKIPFSSNIHPEDMQLFVKIMKDTAAGTPYSETEFRIRDITGNYLWCRIRATTQYDEKKRPIKAVGVIVDIDSEKRQKEELMEQAQRDPLTGLYNKITINNLVAKAMRDIRKKGYQALLIVDVDQFKAVNDIYGHLCGDGILSKVAEVIKNNIRSSDLAGRIGGDEFLVYLPDVMDENVAIQKANTLLNAFQMLVPQEAAPPISCSIGIAVFGHGEVEYQTFFKLADMALYHRKNNGRRGVTIYNQSLGSGDIHNVYRTDVDNETDGIIEDQMAQYAFRTLYSEKDIKTAIDRLLAIIGRSYNVSRVYIFESSEDGTTCSNTFEWCAEGVEAEKDNLQNLSYIEDLDDYQANFNQEGLFYCPDIREVQSNLRNVLEPQGIRSMLQCAMLDKGEFVGYVGFDECRNYRAWKSHQVASFKFTADVLSTFLIKFRYEQKN